MIESQSKRERNQFILALVLIILAASNALTLPAFLELKQKYDKLGNDYSDLSANYNTLEIWYSAIRNSINLRLALTKEDRKKFITPDDPNVKSLVFQITGGWNNTSDMNEYWKDLYKMYRWVVDNVEYSYDTPLPIMPEVGKPVVSEIYKKIQWKEEYWRFPNETIREKRGDCEDQALLLASMILSYENRKYPVWAIKLSNGTLGHLAVALSVTDKELTILDPAGKFYTADIEGNLCSKDVRSAIREWEFYWNFHGYGGTIPDLIFSETEYREFSSTLDFIDWMLNRK
ncbi:MAG: transglutaminase-like domain-containing protein [Thermoproteota archaeon]